MRLFWFPYGVWFCATRSVVQLPSVVAAIRWSPPSYLQAHSARWRLFTVRVSQPPPSHNAILAPCCCDHRSSLRYGSLSRTWLARGFLFDSVLPSTMCLHGHHSSLGIDPSTISPCWVFMAPWESCHGPFGSLCLVG